MENEFLFEVVEEYFKIHNIGPRKWNFHTFWYWKNIPPKRLKQARNYFAPYDEKMERPLLVMSDNAFGKLYRGMLITNIKLYYYLNLNDSLKFGPETKNDIIILSDMYHIEIETKKYGAWLVVNREREAYFARYSEGIVDESEAKLFRNALNHVLQALHERNTNKKAP